MRCGTLQRVRCRVSLGKAISVFRRGRQYRWVRAAANYYGKHQWSVPPCAVNLNRSNSPMSEPIGSHVDRLAMVETIGSVLWFFMDGFWMLSLPFAAKSMVAPTLAVNLLVFRYTRRSLSQFAIASAMNSWLLMNILWMLGDLEKDP